MNEDEVTNTESNSENLLAGGPIINVTTNTNPNPGDVFYDYQVGFPVTGTKLTACYMVQSNGDSVFSHHGHGVIADFEINHNGYLTFMDENSGGYKMYDSSYHYMRSFSVVNGYTTDVHEFQIFPDGHYFLLGDDPEIIDMTQYGYPSDAMVVGSVIQEFDAGDHLLFEWNSFDHIFIDEALHEYLGSKYIDYVHSNSIEQDTDGNIVVSHRHLDQVNKINVQTGNFIWRLGGTRNQFTFIGDSLKFTYQHDARLLPNGHLTLFDNGNYHPQPVSSCAKEYLLDVVHKTATLVWSYSHAVVNGAHVFGNAMGSVQRFANGGTFINWGWIPNSTGIPNMTELDSGNQIVWEAKITPGAYNVIYRAHRFVWTPCARVSPQTMKVLNITANSAILAWSNATNALSYQIQYRDSSGAAWQNLNLAASSDTMVDLSNLQPATTYEWRIQTFCSAPNADSSHYTAVQEFTTLSATAVVSVDKESIRIFPNPASLFTSVSLPALPSCEILLMNEVGTVFQIEQVKNGTTIAIDLSHVPDGTYFVKVISDEKTFIGKVMVEK